MSRFARSVFLCVLVVLLTPSPAHAWFEWLDYLSGPGRWWGARIDVRAWCSGSKTISEQIKAAEGLPSFALARSFDATLDVNGVVGDWRNVAASIASINEAFPAINPALLKKLQETAQNLQPSDVTNFRQFYATAPQPRISSIQPGRTTLNVENMISLTDMAFAELFRAQVALSSAGIFISLCSPDIDRRFAIEVSYATMQANSNPQWANNHTIRSNGFTGAVSWRAFRRPTRDFLDVGVNAGTNVFSSHGFETFQAMTVQPFFDLHGPSAWINQGGWRKVLSLVTVRKGVLFFPNGLDLNKFAPLTTPDQNPAAGDPTRAYTIYFNISPLLRHRPSPFVMGGSASQ